jgi:light-regulated signal transduction histidine kinase (bacteriophytochrome)
MLDDMVEYLSVTSRTVASTEVDLNACLKQAMSNLRTVVEETHAQIRSPQLPASTGDQSQLVHVFQNLLSNAIKFRGTRPPMVTITCEPHGSQWLLGVHDNGIGIPKEFTERIFELGRRLHTREEYPGSGIGLALCRRIVERHGGRIWAESQNGEGSTFYVLLPRGRHEAGADSGGGADAVHAPREDQP